MSRSDDWLSSDFEFASFIEHLTLTVRTSEGKRRAFRAEGRQIVPYGDRLAREFTAQTEVFRMAMRRRITNDQPLRAA